MFLKTQDVKQNQWVIQTPVCIRFQKYVRKQHREFWKSEAYTGVKPECILSKFYSFLLFSFTYFYFSPEKFTQEDKRKARKKDYTVLFAEGDSSCETRREIYNVIWDCKTGNS